MSWDTDMAIDESHGGRPAPRRKVVAYLDIETATQPEVLRHLALGVQVDGPQGVVAWTAEHAADRALDPHGGRVICWALVTSEGHEDSWIDRSPTATSEREGLEQLQESLAVARQVVAHNGHAFDFPFLRARAMSVGLPGLARQVWQAKPWDDRLVDTSDPSWCPRPVRGGSSEWRWTLDALASLLGVHRPETIPGADVPAAWYAQRFDDILEHCRDDVRTLRAVHRRLAQGRGE